ncbi:MAG: ABC transporter permease [Ruminococcus sp.]|nr:ABC transporter permease [Ruminococcus sp.]
MFLHNLKYEMLSSLRVKDITIWLILFPVALGMFFKIAFGNVYDKTTKFDTIPVAVVEEAEDQTLHSVLDSIESQDEPLLKVEYTDMEKAEELLRDGKIEGILTAGEKLSLTAADSNMRTTILSSFIKQYNSRQSIITDCMKKDPTRIQEVIDSFSEETDVLREIPLSSGNTNYMTDYFYNLIAMVALFGSITGLHITINNQANLSPLGARKCCSPAPKSISLAASLAGSYIVQTICMLFCVTFVRFGLKIDLGSHLLLVYLSAVLSGILGVSLGFFIGSVGFLKTNTKVAISTSVSLLLCFFSGLMIANMKVRVDEVCPLFNRINPAAVITNSLYYLNVYDNYDKFTVCIITMVITTVLLDVFGLLLTRRKKYASL